MKLAKASKNPSINEDIGNIAARFLLVKKEIESLERLQASYRSMLESACLENSGKLELPEFAISVNRCERESFALKTARENISAEILRPYVTVSHYNRLVVSPKKRMAA